MTEEIKCAVAPSRQAPVAGVTRIVPKYNLDSGKCEVNMHLGLFFDGTNNNMDNDKPGLGHSNVVRLFDAYVNQPTDGYFSTYVNGVGTPFSEIGEEGNSTFGNGFGIGCEGRVLYGLLAVFDSIHRRAYGEALFSSTQIKALCRNGAIVSDEDEQKALKKLGVSEGLLMPKLYGKGPREDFLKRQASLLEKKMASHGKPDVKECFIDVFGFSRGAAEARVFCQWLDQLLVGGELAGVIIRLRFVGLMDTVASAGFWTGVVGAITNSTDGHGGWATPENLRIPGLVENCVHMVAMHELRKNFPLDELGVDGVLPPHCQQFAYPGSHSDVGGGYLPAELGISVGKTKFESDALKLAQIPLNHMLACAVAAGVPASKERAKDTTTGYDPFAIDPRVEQAFNDFLEESTMTARQMHDWSQPYLNWRWQVCKSYEYLHHVQNANAEDRKLLVNCNKKLIADAGVIGSRGDVAKSQGFLNGMFSNSAKLKDAKFRQEELSSLDPEAPAVLSMAQKAPHTPNALAALFDGYIHDSMAGFSKSLMEPTGYWRYRKGFRGGHEAIIAFNDAINSSSIERVASNDVTDQNVARG
jgi:hypothetical protein